MDVEIKNKMLELESNHSEFQKTNTVICELVKEMIFPAFLEKRIMRLF